MPESAVVLLRLHRQQPGPHRTLEAERFDAVLRKRGLSELRDKAADFIITVGCLDNGIDGSCLCQVLVIAVESCAASVQLCVSCGALQ